MAQRDRRAARRPGAAATRQALAKLLAEGFERVSGSVSSADRRSQSQAGFRRSRQLLDDRDDYLVVVGTLHLVGKDSVIDLLERKGYQRSTQL